VASPQWDETGRQGPAIARLLGRVHPAGQGLAGGALSGQGSGRGLGADRAELRLLPLLATHPSFLEVAGELFLSSKASRRRRPRSTASWGDSSRSQAVARARNLALLDR
jgi:hypothetical protein